MKQKTDRFQKGGANTRWCGVLLFWIFCFCFCLGGRWGNVSINVGAPAGQRGHWIPRTEMALSLQWVLGTWCRSIKHSTTKWSLLPPLKIHQFTWGWQGEMPCSTCRGQRMVLWSCFSPPTLIPGIELRLSGWMASPVPTELYQLCPLHDNPSQWPQLSLSRMFQSFTCSFLLLQGTACKRHSINVYEGYYMQ